MRIFVTLLIIPFITSCQTVSDTSNLLILSNRIEQLEADKSNLKIAKIQEASAQYNLAEILNYVSNSLERLEEKEYKVQVERDPKLVEAVQAVSVRVSEVYKLLGETKESMKDLNVITLNEGFVRNETPIINNDPNKMTPQEFIKTLRLTKDKLSDRDFKKFVDELLNKVD